MSGRNALIDPPRRAQDPGELGASAEETADPPLEIQVSEPPPARPRPKPRPHYWWLPVGVAGGVALAGGLAVILIQIHSPGDVDYYSIATTSAQPVDSPSATPNSGPVPSQSAAPDSISPTSGSGPGVVVEEYFDAINQGDYSRAWSLGGKNLSASYEQFVSGFTSSMNTSVTVVSTNGGQVQVVVSVVGIDGTQRTYSGTYSVTSGMITTADLTEIS